MCLSEPLLSPYCAPTPNPNPLETTGLCSSLSLLATRNTVSDSVTETILKC